MRSRSWPTIFAEYASETIRSTSPARASSASLGAPLAAAPEGAGADAGTVGAAEAGGGATEAPAVDAAAGGAGGAGGGGGAVFVDGSGA
jgi:hypothetical protein